MEADTDRISVEMFSDLLRRLLIADLQGLGMHEPSHAGQEQIVMPR
jgi:thermostable 8-oxoguanine DNA glycosylase